MRNKNYVDKIKHNVRNTKEGSIKDVMQEFLSYYHIDANLNQEDIILVWREITGELIKKLTTKIDVQNNCLYVKVNSSALKHELMMVRTSILGKIKAKIPKCNLKNIYIS
ncbi:MAG: DUF721 domain-containing protein [Bacteroidaceae bacterium]|nr:DUF721 domain-containing protein [Bacteroidaceae bacterium]